MFPDTIRDIVTHIYVAGDWQDISSDVQYDNGRGCTVERGRRDESPRASAQKLRLTLNDTSGNYSPKNPEGAWWPDFGLNTPIRQYFREIRDRFGRTVVDSPGTTDTGQTWVTSGSGGSILAADYQVTGTALTMRLPTSGLYRRVGIDDSELYLSTVEKRADFTLPFSNVTGGTISFGLHLCVGDTTGYQVYADIATDETITIRIASPDGDLDSELVSGLTHTGQTLTLVASREGETIRGKVFATSGVEPYGWHLEVHDSGDLIGPGGTIVEVAAASGNTNTRPFLTTVDNVEILSPRIYAEISSPPRGRDESGNWQYVSVTASGILQRLSQGQDALKSSLRRAYLADDIDRPIGYWPMEDGRDATQIAAATPDTQPGTVFGTASFASNSDFAASEDLPTLGTAQLGFVVPPYDTSTNEFQARLLVSIPTAGDAGGTGTILWRLLTTGTARYWDLHYVNSGNGKLALVVRDAGYASLYASGDVEFDMNGDPCRLSMELTQDGADIDWAISKLSVGAGSAGGISNTLAGNTVGTVVGMYISQGGYSSTAVGHLTAQNGVTSLFELAAELEAHVGETAARRARRLCGEESIPFQYRGLLSATAAMGPQRPKTLLDLLYECADAERGSLAEARGSFALAWRSRTSAYDQDAVATVDYATKQVGYPLVPNPDDLLPRNRITVKRDSGSEATAVQESGRMSILAPQDGGIGTYGTSVTLNVETDTQLPDLASFMLGLATVPDERYPEINIDTGRSPVADDPVLRWAALDIDVDDLVVVTNTAGLRVFEDIKQLARGYRETYTQHSHVITVNGTPARPYEVLELDSDDFARVDTEGSELAVAIDSDDTALSVATTSGPLWITTASHPTHLPFDWMIGGERVTVTDLDNVAITYRSVGTAAHGDNAAVTPGLPTGNADDDLLLMVTAIRNTAATPSASTQGYTAIWSDGNVVWWAKIRSGAQTAPQVSFTGGSAGDTTSAQIIALPGKWHDLSNIVVNKAAALNASAQDIAYPGLSLTQAGPGLGAVNDCIVIYAGWKQDDFTSVASPGTEIAEASTTTGNDQSLVWAYTIQTTATNIAPGSFTVTGGASAVSKGYVLALRCDRQTATVTRSVNGVTKSHAAGAAVELADPVVWAL